MEERVPAEVFLPGGFVKEELESRGWTQNDLAEILEKSGRFVSDIINGKNTITPATAVNLGQAFGVSAEYWLNLESAYQLARSAKADDTVSRRARLFGKVPLKDMIKRGWIDTSKDIAVMERRVLDFLEIASIEEQPEFLAHAARKSSTYSEVTPAQLAWLIRARHLSKLLTPQEFSKSQLEQTSKRLMNLIDVPEGVDQIPRILSEGGIRFLVVETLPRTKIDGACFWLDENSPVIALSLRYDRIDYFWHTIMHELGHLKNEDGLSIDKDMLGEASGIEDKPPSEAAADQFAVNCLVSQDELEDFMLRVGPIYPKIRLIGFAALMKVHPGIVLGQLQHRKEVSYSKYRDLLVKIRETITSTALTDGFGNALPSYP